MITIREAQAADAQALAALSLELGYQTTVEELGIQLTKICHRGGDSKIMIAELEQRVVGFVAFDKYLTIYYPDGVNITGLVVSSHHRKRGIGKLLLESVETYAKENRLVFIRANSGSHRDDAHQFYRKMGFASEKLQIRFIKNL